ncbi:MAG: ketose-bisphosphate aldolase, partial [Candidatus Electrothrix sp. AR3]|nr:ketose-bisphosphate aldolase [Candidatus Electrothrix sp. AR3]
NRYIPSWAGYETEVGEIKGTMGMSSADEALFLIQGLNAHNIFPDWIALNNGSCHGLEASGQGIQPELTAEIHEALKGYGVSGAQHGTSGNSSERLRTIAQQTRTTKANVATGLQMISWGVEVNDYGNAILDGEGEFVKVPGQGVSEELWLEMKAYARAQGWAQGNYKKLNTVFENRIMGQPKAIRERMAQRVSDFIYTMLTQVFNAGGTAQYAVEAILAAGSYDLGPKTGRMESPEDWTEEKIRARAAALDTDKGPEGDFDD